MGSIGLITIITQESKHYYLTPANPLDPTMVHVRGNTDELIAFCDIVNALKANQSPDYDENPYVRQFQKEDKPVYLMNLKDIHWDQNVSPWEYYYEFVPANEDKKRRLVAKIFKNSYWVVYLFRLWFSCMLYFYISNGNCAY
jgi:hypothetical protein